MVMNTFRSKLRRRRDELFRRGSDESDEWQFVPFNPSVFPANNNSVNHNKNNGGSSPPSNSTPKPALRPWAIMQRASWHETQPPVPPHGHGSIVKGYFPLPPCPEAPTPPPHGHGYPGSVPNWYGAQYMAEPMHYPASVPPGQSRPSPVVFRRTNQNSPSSDQPSPPSIGQGPGSSSRSTIGLPRPNSAEFPSNSVQSRPKSGGHQPSSGEVAKNASPRPSSDEFHLNNEAKISNVEPRPRKSGGSRPNSGTFHSNRKESGSSNNVPKESSARPRANTGGSRPNSAEIRYFEGSREAVQARPEARPVSGSWDVVDRGFISPEGDPPKVPPHGRPSVPPHVSGSCNSMPPSNPLPLPPPPTVPVPPPPVPAHAFEVNPVQQPLPPPPPAPTKPCSLNLEQQASFLPVLMSPNHEQHQRVSPMQPACNSPEYKIPVDQSPEYKSPCTSADDSEEEKEESKGDKVSCASGGCASGNKEQRRSDPGSVGGVTVSNNHTSSSTPASTNTTHTNASTTSTDLTNNVGDSVNDFASPDTASPNVCSSTDSPPLAALAAKPNLQKKKSGVSINRSESCKEKQPGRKRTRENRKHSDPNIPTSKSGDVDAESNLISGNSGSSSNSSLSQSLESPSTSLEQVSRPDAPLPTPVLENDSDIEAEVDLPNWQQPLSHEQIKRLKPKERKRQDTINELFHTERTHVRILKVLKHLFHMPMAEAGLLPKDQLDMLFPNLDQILEIHTNFNQSMKKRRQEEALVLRVGDLLSAMFDGEKGDHFQQQAAEFVRQQSISLENLKQRQKRDQRLCNFLQEQENNPACRRLQLKDMLPAGFQRLTKYPLLMESLLAYTDSNKHPEEYEQISRALERAKEILAHVNAAVQEAENNQRLSEIQRRLDQSSLAKNKSGLSDELKGNLDLTKHKLIHEGPLTWRIAKGQKNIDLLVLLLEEFIVLLQKSDDKYILKNHSISKSLVKDDYKLTHSPIIKYGPSMLFRAVATDRCAFFIVTTQSIGAHIYEFVAISANERKVWFRHIQEAQEAYTARDGRNRRSHPPTPLPDPDDQAPAAADAIRDVDDGDDDGGEMTEGTNDIAGETKLQTGGVSNSPEQTGKSDEWSSSTTTPAAASQTPGSPDTLSKKTEVGGASSSSSGQGGPSPTAGRSPASGRRLQEVQIIQIVEGPTLIQPSEVKVSQGVVLSAEPVLTPIEHLRRKDIKIRQALEEKQHIIADILNIPHEHFENVADMAGEPAVGNKEPRELVLAAMFQAKCLQETLNEALNIGEGDIIAARTNNDGANKASSLPLYQAPMTKLMNISTALSQQLSSLLNLVSERDDERERMRKELVASRERLHLFHMKQNSISSQPLSTATVASVTPPTATSPHTSRPSSFVSVSSSAADHSDTPDHHDTDEEGRNEVPKISSMPLEEGGDPKEESVLEAFEDAVSGSESTEIPPHDSEPPAGREDCGEETSSDRGCEINTETSTT